MTEAELLRLEAEIPELARAASRTAFETAIEVSSVIVFADNALVEVFRDGTRVLLESMALLAEIDWMQHEVREYLVKHPSELAAA